jgi:hypothetical protein
VNFLRVILLFHQKFDNVALLKHCRKQSFSGFDIENLFQQPWKSLAGSSFLVIIGPVATRTDKIRELARFFLVAESPET